MPRATKRVCAQPGCPAMQAERLCATHRAERDRYQRQTTPTKVTRTWSEQQRRKRVVDEHRARYGNWCPGYLTAPHTDEDLTADHVIPIDRGGDPHGALSVLCRSCNSRKAARP